MPEQEKHRPSDALKMDLAGLLRCQFCGLGFTRRPYALKHLYEKHPDRLKQ